MIAFIARFYNTIFTRDYRMFGAARSPKWADVRDAWLKDHPNCAVCNKHDNLAVHHKKPFHIFPELELNPVNFVTLCEAAGMNCHITFGHLGNWKSYNENIEADIIIWQDKVSNRP